MAISTSSQSNDFEPLILHPSSGLVPLNCSVSGNPLPRFSWTLNDGQDDRAIVSVRQIPTLFDEPAVSVLEIDVKKLKLGNHTVQCTATSEPLTQNTSRLRSNVSVDIIVTPYVSTVAGKLSDSYNYSFQYIGTEC